MIKWRFVRLTKCLDNLSVDNITFSQSLEIYSELRAMSTFYSTKTTKYTNKSTNKLHFPTRSSTNN